MLGALANKMTLAEGVLDGTESSLANAKLKRGADSNLAQTTRQTVSQENNVQPIDDQRENE